MAQIGRKINIGIGKESSPGTPVTADFWIPVTDKGLNPKNEIVDDDGARGIIEGVGGSEITREWNEPAFEGLIFDRSFGLLMLAALGTVSTSADDPEAGVNTHSFSLDDDSNAHPALSIIQKDDVIVKGVSYAILNNLSIEAVTNEWAKFTADFISKKDATVTPTPAFTAENRFVPKFVTVKIATNVAGLTAASALVTESIRLNIEKNTEAYFPHGDSEPNVINNGTMRVTGEISLRLDTVELRDLFQAGTKKALRITLENTGVTIGAATNPKIEIDLGLVSFRDWNSDNSNDAFIMQTVPFTAEVPASDAFIAGEMINTETSY